MTKRDLVMLAAIPATAVVLAFVYIVVQTVLVLLAFNGAR